MGVFIKIISTEKTFALLKSAQKKHFFLEFFLKESSWRALLNHLKIGRSSILQCSSFNYLTKFGRSSIFIKQPPLFLPSQHPAAAAAGFRATRAAAARATLGRSPPGPPKGDFRPGWGRADGVRKSPGRGSVEKDMAMGQTLVPSEPQNSW